MYTEKPLCRTCQVGGRVLSSVGLGAPDEYSKLSKPGELLTTASMIGKFTGTGLVASMLPQGVVKAAGIDMNPGALLLAPFTFGASLLPGISQLIGSIFGGMFSKATHMGDCMKGWSDDNIRRYYYIAPLKFDFHSYMMTNFPQFLQQYQTMQADGQWRKVGIDQLVSYGNRQQRVGDEIISIVRANPDIMELQCAVQERAETGYTGYTPAQVDKFWSQIKESARQREYAKLVKEVDRKVEPYKVKETWGEIVKTRNEGLLTNAYDKNARLPDNVIGINRGGVFNMVLQSGQRSLKPVKFKRG